jgi:3-isopropylmalate/(R)-2-methylmalate dehydratase small subunit
VTAKLEVIRSRTVALPTENIDTDQIIPARFLLATTKAGYGQGLFDGWRFDAQGMPRPEFPLNRPEAKDAHVLVAGRNFGCGSSREHAAWALAEYGFRAVISTSFADIFRSNALKNGLLPVVVDGPTHAKLLAAPGSEVAIDLAERTLTLQDGTRVAFPIEPFARYCLMNGVDELAFLLSRESEIAAFEAKNGSVPWRSTS